MPEHTLCLSALFMLFLALTTTTAAQLYGPFKIIATSPRSRVNQSYIRLISTEGTSFAPVYTSNISTASDFYLNTSTGLLSTLVDDRYLDKTVRVFAYGRYNAQRYRGELTFNTKQRVGGGEGFEQNKWECEVDREADGSGLRCKGRYGDQLFVCREYDWTFLRSEKPDLACEGLKFNVASNTPQRV